MNMKYWLIFLVVLAPGLAVAQAPQRDPLNGKFGFRIGAQAFTTVSTTIRIDSATLGLGTEFNFEDETGLEEEVTVARLDGLYRFTDRHGVTFSYFDISRTGSRTLSIDIDWGEETFMATETVQSKWDQEIFQVSYSYTFLRRPNATMGAGVGLHVMDFNTSLRTVNGTRARSNSVTAPLPVIGLKGQYRFSDKWRFVGSLDVFSLNFDEYDGNFTDLLLSVEYDAWDRFGIGFGLNDFGLDVSSGDADLTGTIDIEFESFIFYFKGSFGAN